MGWDGIRSGEWLWWGYKRGSRMCCLGGGKVVGRGVELFGGGDGDSEGVSGGFWMD